MEKPKITQGEWKWQRFGDEYYLTGQHGMRPMVLATLDGKIAIRENGLLEELHPEHPDAKAIEAAPDLLKNLMDTYEWMLELNKTHSHLVPEGELRLIEEALQKAGVNLNAKAE